MFSELEKYKEKDHFFMMPGTNLKKVCNAPADKSGVFIVYTLKKGRIDMVYIGRSEELMLEGKIFVNKDGLGGLKDILINGEQFGKPRHESWPEILKKESIEGLDIYWYVTHNDKIQDFPKKIQKKLLQVFQSVYSRLPRWNEGE